MQCNIAYITLKVQLGIGLTGGEQVCAYVTWIHCEGGRPSEAKKEVQEKVGMRAEEVRSTSSCPQGCPLSMHSLHKSALWSLVDVS